MTVRLHRRLIRAAVRRVGYNISRWPPLVEQLEGHLAGLLPRLGVNCVLDVGAHCGEYATSLRRLGFDGRIVSFEPVAESYERVAALARNDGRWFVHHLALGSINDRSLINIPGDTVLASFLEPNAFALGRFPNSRVAQRQEIEVRTLDRVINACLDGLTQPKVYLKLDTQGWDLEVLAGSRTALQYIVGLQSELSVKPINVGMPTYLQALDVIQSLGFELTGIYPISRDRSSQIIELDAVFIRVG